MTLQDLKVEEIVELMAASKKLISHYRGDVDRKVSHQCPICWICNKLDKKYDFDKEIDGCYVGKCICCPWVMLDGIECASVRHPVSEITRLNMTYGVNAIRRDPASYTKQAAKAIERHERWMTIYQAEIDRR